VACDLNGRLSPFAAVGECTGMGDTNSAGKTGQRFAFGMTKKRGWIPE
jgi:hypothetical protein